MSEYQPRRFSATDFPRNGQRVRYQPEGYAEGDGIVMAADSGAAFEVESNCLCDVVSVDVAAKDAVVTFYVRDPNDEKKAIPHRVSAVPLSDLVSNKGRPYIIGVDERRNTTPPTKAGHVAPRVPVTPKVAPVTAKAKAEKGGEDDVTSVLGKLGELLGRGKSPEVDAGEVERIAEAAAKAVTDPLEERVDRLESDVAAVTERVDDVESKVADVESKVTDVLDALAAASAPAKARVRSALAKSAATGNPITDALAIWYAIGEDRTANVLLLSPPSLGKSYAVREFGRAYDVYLEHGCSDDVDEISALLGSPTPDNVRGGFVVSDGVLAQAVREASQGKSVLLLLDEVLRLSPRWQEWLLSFLTGFKRPDGTREYRLRTRRVMPDGTLEVLACDAANLHIVGAGNLGMTAPVEAFWSRWESVRFQFDPATIRAVSTAVLGSFGVTGAAADKLAATYTAIVTDSRKEVAKGTLRFPADIRMLERACAVSEASAGAVAKTLAGRLVDNLANWSADLGDTDAESAKVCATWSSNLLALATLR